MERLDSVQTVIAAFDHVNLVALGERHWSREDAQFRNRLVQNPVFAQKVNDIVIEFGNPLYQTVLTRFVDGGDVPSAELRKVWQDTTMPGAWDSPVYEEFLIAVRTANTKLEPSRRLRVLAGDYPIQWSAISKPAELPDLDARDRSAAAIIRREVIDRGRKALVLFGSIHIYRDRPGTIVDLLKEDSNTRCYIVVPIGGPGPPAAITANGASPTEPALISLANTSVGDLWASDVLERGTKRIKVADGKPVFVDGRPVFIPVFEPNIKVRQLADAFLFFGDAPDEFVKPPAILYDGTHYGRELLRRRKILTPS